MLRLFPAITVIVLLLPVLAGLIGTVAPGFGYFPAVGGTSLSVQPFRDLFDWAGFMPALGLSLRTGLIATAASLIITLVLLAGWHDTRAFRWVERVLSPLLSAPHAAAAFGIAFLIAPSGWIVRALSPWATGWQRPPDLLIVQDPGGWAMIAGLVAKEVPFLMLMSLAALPQTAPEHSLRITAALGYGRVAGWFKAIFPRLYARIRLPVYAVLAYSLSVVDVAIILGPNTPPPLAVQVVKWMGDPDLSMRLVASAGAVVQLALVIGVLCLWRLMELLVTYAGLRAIYGGHRMRRDGAVRAAGLGLGAISAGMVILGLAGLAVWSVAGFWSFPNALPDAISSRSWMRFGPDLLHPLNHTFVIAGAATGIALILTIACLEAEHRHALTPASRSLWILYLPLLVPQVAFLPGLQAITLLLGGGTHLGMVVLGHLVFVLPYVFLSLAGPWRQWDARFDTVGAALGVTPNARFWRIRMPMMVAPVLTALAVGLAVSVGQYLPTLLIGGGRVQTITTEAVALASGGDRRVIGVTGLVQTGAAMVGFAAALLLPRMLWHNRRGMRG